MSKEYNLNIPEMIRKENSYIAWLLSGLTKIKDDWVTRDYMFKDIPKDWLEEIKDEPVSIKEIIDGIMPVLFLKDDKDKPIYDRNQVLAIAGRIEANNELRHRPKQTIKEMYDELYTGTIRSQMDYTMFVSGFEASERNRGY